MVGNLSNGKLNFVANDVNLYLDEEDIFIAIDGRSKQKDNLQKVKQLYIEYGEDFVSKIDDNMAIYLYDKKENVFIIVRDIAGLVPVYYGVIKDAIYFGNDLLEIIDTY